MTNSLDLTSKLGERERTDAPTATANTEARTGSGPTRGALRLNASASSPQVVAGADFSIFVNIQNPFDVPITIYKVDTHIPIELVDVNGRRIEKARKSGGENLPSLKKILLNWMRDLIFGTNNYSGVAIAVGTDFNPDHAKTLVAMSTQIENISSAGDVSISGIHMVFPENPTTEELDRIFLRVIDYQKGLVPTTLQAGDSVVKQFVLRTRRWLFFAPLSHVFQIQVNYAVDGFDHSGTISYEQRIAAPLRSVALGSIVGAALGATLKNITQQGTDAGNFFPTLIAAMLSSIAVTIAFARKTSAQPIISIEDFWGGSLIGFSVGFFGFDQFSGLFHR